MKVYLVCLHTLDFCENSVDSTLLGVFANKKDAIQAQNNYVRQKIEQCKAVGMYAQSSEWYDGSRIITGFSGNKRVMSFTFLIEERPLE